MVNTHYLAENVVNYIDGGPFRQSVTFAKEGTLLGTAGTLVANNDFFGGQDGWLIHADNYCLADLNAFADAHAHRPRGCLMTMMTFRTDKPQQCGILELDESGVVVGFHEKVEDPPGNLANGAIYLLTAELIKQLSTCRPVPVDFTNDVIPTLLGKIFTYETHDHLCDIGTPEALASLQSESPATIFG